MLFSLSLRQVWREKQSREFRILAFALWLSIFAVTVLASLTSALHSALNKDVANLLGADLIAEASNPIAREFQQIAEKEGLDVSSMVEFFSMIIKNEKMQLTTINAIENQYPLRGTLTLKTTDSSEKTVFAPPPAGEIWCDEDLVHRLEIQLMDEISLGDSKLTVSGIIQNRPVATSNSTVLAPLAYVNAADLSNLGVLQPGSRATYRLLFRGSAEQLAAYRLAVENKSSDIQWVTTQSGRPALNRTLKDVERYVAVILLIQVFMAAIAIAMCTHQYSIRQRHQVAIWRCLGASSRTIVGCHILALLFIFIFIIFTSVIAGYAVAYLVDQTFHPLGGASVLGSEGGILGVAIGLILLTGFGLPPLLELRKVSPIQIFQRQVIPSSWTRILSYSITTLFLALLIIHFIGKEEEALSLSFSVKIFGIGALALAVIYGLWRTFLPLSQKGSLTWRLGLSYLVRHQWQTITQLLVFTMVLTFLLLLQILRYDFIQRWQTQLSKTTPNYFIINVQSNQVDILRSWFVSRGINDVEFYPIVRGRMLKINGVRIQEGAQDLDKKKGLNRPINLTWMEQLPKDNQIISGISWDEVAIGQPLISVEKGFADRQHLKLGDTLQFEVADQEISGKIVSFRTVDWESFKPNFFVIFPPDVIDDFPHTYFTSVYLSAAQRPFILDLAKSFVEISIIDIDGILSKVTEMVDKIALALNVLLMIVFILGVLIMYANLISTLKERLQESAMLRILGARKILIGNMLIFEFIVLGGLSGLMASIMAIVLARELAQQFFALAFVFHIKWILIGLLMGMILITIFGLLGTRDIFKVSPLRLFRQS